MAFHEYVFNYQDSSPVYCYIHSFIILLRKIQKSHNFIIYFCYGVSPWISPLFCVWIRLYQNGSFHLSNVQFAPLYAVPQKKGSLYAFCRPLVRMLCVQHCNCGGQHPNANVTFVVTVRLVKGSVLVMGTTLVQQDVPFGHICGPQHVSPIDGFAQPP